MPVRRPVAEQFQTIRTWEGRRDRAFEELCFQLRDPTPPGVELRKTRAPDAGVEWYWRYSDGHEEGWQAKFIFDSDTLVDAMGSSLDTVRDKRPDVQKLTFCLPLDLADDPSKSRGEQLRQKLDRAIARWRKRAPQITVEILHGGELLERLTREEHRGREWFFFHERVLGRGWCAEALAGTVEDAGSRYTPQQDVDLPIDHVLEAVALSAGFLQALRSRREFVLLRARKFIGERDEEAWRTEFKRARDVLAKIEGALLVHEAERFSGAALLEAVDENIAALRALDDVVRPIASPPSDNSPNLSRSTTQATSSDHAEEAAARAAELERMRAQSLWNQSAELKMGLRELGRFLGGPAGQCAERQALFVTGHAGSGKTHLCCDVAERLLAEGHPVLVMLGDKFRDASPWQTLARELGDPGLAPAEVATCLAASGEAAGKRAFVVIDALNETPDARMWATQLADLRRRFTQTGWVGFAVTCRTTYLDVVEPAGGRDEAFQWVEHPGYRGREFEATEQIFAANKIPAPRFPLLVPEFSNPLFLKLYCEGVARERRALAGTEHLSEVFSRFIENRARAVEKKLKLDRHLNLVWQGMQVLAQRLAESGVEELAYAEAWELVNALVPHKRDSPDTLLETMVAEGLLALERIYVPEVAERQVFIGFPYQRFSDHLILGAFLGNHLPDTQPDEVAAAFAKDQPVGRWLRRAPRGLIEALALQLPERWGLELPDLLAEPTSPSDWEELELRGFVWEAFAASLVARDRQAFSDRTTALVNEALNTHAEAIFDALHSVAPDPQHPINALALHAYLRSIPMPDRDAWWTRLHYDSFGNPSTALDRLIRWAARGPYPNYPEDVIELAGTALSWVFASPNRFARDYTTKAVASLLIGRVPIATRLVLRFASVDDPYVKQRVAATCLGAVTRTDPSELKSKEAANLIDALLAMVESDTTLPDVLLRDHVATLAWWLSAQRLIGRRRLSRARGPYRSRPPKTPRLKKYLEEAYPRSDEREQGYGSLQFSALEDWSDWSRYVVSGRVDDFLQTRIGESLPAPAEVQEPPPAVRVDRRAWNRVLRSLNEKQLALLREEPPPVDALLDSFSDSQRELMRKVFVERRVRPRRVHQKPLACPPERASRFIYQRCIELGWTPERFAEFDYWIARRDRGRDDHKPERFGKKYQWIAFHELIARLADNYIYNNWDGVVAYGGAWQQSLRDIDPSLPPEPIAVGNDQEHERSPTFLVQKKPTWWTTGSPQFDLPIPGAEGAWAQRREDLPTVEEVVRVTDPEGQQWVVVEGYRNWREDPFEIPTLEAITGPERDLAILIGSTLIEAKNLSTLLEWLSGNPDLLRALPDWHSQGIFEGFLAELPQAQDKFGHPGGWRPNGAWDRLPVRSAAASLGYTSEGNGFDCSLSESVSLELPGKMLFDLAGMHWSEAALSWADQHGGLVARYHETDEGFHRDRALVVSEGILGKLLRGNDLVLAVGLFCERRVFRRASKHASPDRLGWVDYVGHALFDGNQWRIRGLDAYKDRE